MGLATERSAGRGREASPLFGKGALLALLVWGIFVVAITGGIAGVTLFWPLLPILGAAVPLIFTALAVWHATNQRNTLQDRQTYAMLAPEEHDEREVLRVLLQNGELTPAIIAAHTTLSVSRVSDVLESLAGKGHLQMRALEGNLVYSIQGLPRPVPHDGAPSEIPPDATAVSKTLAEPGESSIASFPGEHPQNLEEPLSEREFEVLKLMASGRTNNEIAQELYVAPGTVKAHIANTYRKLKARNRAEAIGRARHLSLLE